MYLKKITALRNLGKFHEAWISGGEYAKCTLFYAGNGGGKTTLCAAMRSFHSNDPALVLERKTFDELGSPEIEFLLDSGVAKFSNGKWNSTQPSFHIFDGRFIADNVHTGFEVDTENRRNSYRVVVGPKGVDLAKKIDDLDGQLVAKQTEITAAKRVLQQHVPRGMTLENFLALTGDAGAEKKIADAKLGLKAAENSAEIGERSKLEPLILPSLPQGFGDALAKTLPNVSAEAATMVQAQLDRHKFESDGEQWLAQGLIHVADDACPFCSNDLEGNPLVAAYEGYFSVAYTTFKTELMELRRQVSAALSEAAGVRIAQAIKAAAREATYWREYVDIDLDFPEALDDVEKTVGLFSKTALELIDKKLGAPLEAIPLSKPFESAEADWECKRERLAALNNAMKAANELIQGFKDAIANKNKLAFQSEIDRLTAITTRHTNPVVGLADAFEALVASKAVLAAEKDSRKKELDLYDAAILGEYEADIDKYLSLFGASFKLVNSKKNYVGKIPQLHYCFQFNNAVLDVTAKGHDGNPSFGTTMSAGDKSTFALAFFLVELERDPDLAEKVVVFDDPFTSLDDFRREITVKSITRVADKAAQVIVFSHDKYFLDAVRKKLQIVPWSAIQISSTSRNASLEAWEVEREVKEGYLQDHMQLVEFSEGFSNDARAACMLMRPLLEKYIRYRFPNKIPDGKWLGDMLGIIRDDPAHPLRGVYKELDDINGYTSPFHHDPNTTVNPTEAMAFAKLTLGIIGGC